MNLLVAVDPSQINVELVAEALVVVFSACNAFYVAGEDSGELWIVEGGSLPPKPTDWILGVWPSLHF